MSWNDLLCTLLYVSTVILSVVMVHCTHINGYNYVTINATRELGYKAIESYLIVLCGKMVKLDTIYRATYW